MIAEHAPPLRDGDVLVVTSKALSKTEGRLVVLDSADPDAREEARQQAIEAETVRVVAERGPLRIVETRHGLVAGMTALTDPRGRTDRYGNVLAVTQVAIADEIAAAADLVKGKLGGVPVAVVRGLARDGKLDDDGLGSRALIRGSEEDLFRLGTSEAMAVGREDVGWATEIPPPLHVDAVHVVTSVAASSDVESAVRQGFLGFLAARPDAMWRSCAPGHLTASALVIEPSHRLVLLTLHPRAGMWVQLGGHCEPGDHTLLDAAAREAREESGIGALSFDPAPLGLDVHAITCSLGVPTRHLDVRFLAIAPDGAEPVQSHESVDLQWFPWDAMPQGVSPELPRLLETARMRLGL
jgi:8-oxo-dGTP pyrophosphatase MutT (NUDIX family)